MGIVYANALMLVEASRACPLGKVLVLGRQQSFLSRRQLHVLAQGETISVAALDACVQPYAETFLKTLTGASEVVAIDFSDYEGATLVHDMNAPLPSHLEQQFDTVIDGGTLEHIFNFPVALANCMRALRVGGRLFMFAPANSQMGHGFYQFSPELLYRACSPAHGFEAEQMQAARFKYVHVERGMTGPMLDVIDPEILKARTVVADGRPVGLLFRARKIQHLAEPFAVSPQQSDYVRRWETEAPGHARLPWLFAVFARLPSRVQWRIRDVIGRWYRNTLRNRQWFHRSRKRQK